MSLFRSKSHSLNSCAIIHEFLFTRYITGNDPMFLKQRSVANFPVINGLGFSDPSMFAHRSKVSHSLLFLLSWYMYDLKLRVHERSVISILSKISIFLLTTMAYHKILKVCSHKTVETILFLSSCIVLNVAFFFT